jgi:hypothetical protein
MGKTGWCTLTRASSFACLLLLVYLTACCLIIAQGSSYTLVPFLTRADSASRVLSEEEKTLETRAILGRGTWNLLHTIAAVRYDKTPSLETQAEMTQFVHQLAALYPCPVCAEHFAAMLVDDPPEVRTNAAFSLWLCRTHNRVNERLKKPAFPCTLDALAERWGSCGCFGNATAAEASPVGRPSLKRRAGGGGAPTMAEVWA